MVRNQIRNVLRNQMSEEKKLESIITIMKTTKIYSTAFAMGMVVGSMMTAFIILVILLT